MAATEKRVERFVERYVDSRPKAELLRILAFRPSEYLTLSEILSHTSASSSEIEGAAFELRDCGIVQVKDGPKGTAVSLAQGSVARRLAPALWAFLKRSSSQRRR